MEERKIIIIHIHSNDPGTVIDIANVLKRKRLPAGCKVTPNKEKWTVTVEGADRQTVDVAMRKYVKGFGNGGGHGGYRLTYEIEEMVISERDVLEKQIKSEFEGEAAALKRRQAELEEKWGNERKTLVSALARQQSALKQLRKTLDKAEAERDSAQYRLTIASKELSETRRENDEFRHQMEESRKKPLYSIVYRRFLRFVRR